MYQGEATRPLVLLLLVNEKEPDERQVKRNSMIQDSLLLSAMVVTMKPMQEWKLPQLMQVPAQLLLSGTVLVKARSPRKAVKLSS